MLDRMATNPIKVAVGVAFLGAAAFVAQRTIRNLVRSQADMPENNSTEKLTYFQSGKQKIKWLAKGSFWTAIAITNIALNTL